jgi:hypothetical protein
LADRGNRLRQNPKSYKGFARSLRHQLLFLKNLRGWSSDVEISESLSKQVPPYQDTDDSAIDLLLVPIRMAVFDTSLDRSAQIVSKLKCHSGPGGGIQPP